MSEQLEFYIRSQLLGSGFAILHAGIAQKLSCGLWDSINNASSDFRNIDAIVKRFGTDCEKITVEADGKRFVVLARSISNLALRIHEATGLCLSADFEYQEPAIVDTHNSQSNTNDIQTKIKVNLQEQKRQARLKEQLLENQKHQAWVQQRKADTRADYRENIR